MFKSNTNFKYPLCVKFVKNIVFYVIHLFGSIFSLDLFIKTRLTIL